MGLFDSVAGQVLGAVTGQQQSSGALGAVNDLIQQVGGVGGLQKTFEAQGLGGVAASWIGTGANQAISAEQIQKVLGHEQIQALAEKLGVSTDDVAAQIAQHLPKVIDMLTPNGQVPEAGGLGGALSSVLGSFKG